jgi:hypothetical protein
VGLPSASCLSHRGLERISHLRADRHGDSGALYIFWFAFGGLKIQRGTDIMIISVIDDLVQSFLRWRS